MTCPRGVPWKVSHPGRTVANVEAPCPECSGIMDDLEPEAEMLSRSPRFLCHECQLMFERDPSGLLREVDG
jgi:hypothetical protein